MAKPLIDVQGARELRASMRRAGADMQQMKDAHAAVARVAEGGIRAAAPKASGKLAGTVRSSGTLSAAIVRAGRKSTPYPGANNWGWPQAQGGIRGSFGGNFWMQQGARATQTAWVNIYSSEVQKIADSIKGI